MFKVMPEPTDKHFTRAGFSCCMFALTVWVLAVQRGLRGSHVMLCTAFLLWALPTVVRPPLVFVDIAPDTVCCSGYASTST